MYSHAIASCYLECRKLVRPSPSPVPDCISPCSACTAPYTRERSVKVVRISFAVPHPRFPATSGVKFTQERFYRANLCWARPSSAVSLPKQNGATQWEVLAASLEARPEITALESFQYRKWHIPSQGALQRGRLFLWIVHQWYGNRMVRESSGCQFQDQGKSLYQCSLLTGYSFR